MAEEHQRLGIFGGTFDPIHFGHLRPAIELVESYRLDKLYLLPNHRPAHREPAAATTPQRIDMISRAIKGAEQLTIDTREALRNKPSFTYDTLKEISLEKPHATLLFFMGLDAFADFEKWHRWQDILGLANLVVLSRPESDHSEFSAHLLGQQRKSCGESIRDGQAGVIEECYVTALAISATDVRQYISDGRSARYLTPESVLEYIQLHGLYA